MKQIISLILLLAAANASANSTPNSPHINVKGYAQEYVTPDEVTLNVAIEHTNVDLKVAKSKVDKIVGDAINVAQKFSIGPNDINAAHINVYKDTQYSREQQKNVFVGFKVTRHIKLKLKKINHYPDLLQALVNAGINEFSNASFGYSNRAELEAKLYKQAVANAKFAAKEIASDFDTKIAGVYTISKLPSAQNTRPYMMRAKESAVMSSDVNHSASYNTGDILVSSEIYVTYLIEN